MSEPEDTGDIFEQTRKSQPGTWPTSAMDLINEAPPDQPGVRVGAPPVDGDDPDFAYIPAPDESVGLVGKGQEPPIRVTAGNGAATFTAFARIDGAIGFFELNTSGPAAYIERMIHAFADNFAEELANSKE